MFEDILWLILLVVGAMVAIECLLATVTWFLRRDFQWLITARDEIPSFDKKALQRFFVTGHDKTLGWIRKPDTSGKEGKGSLGGPSGDYKKIIWHINAVGARVNPGHEQMPAVVSAYGDSFTFCRQVEDNKTWQWRLSEMSGTNVMNFGVGNYGIDQSLLRLKMNYDNNPTPYVIIGVVPETIVRILGVWRHYFEFGNTFAFKPRYALNNGEIRLIPNIVDEPTKFYSLSKSLPEIQKHDYYYERKFKRTLLKFPYTAAFLRRPGRHAAMFSSLLAHHVAKSLGWWYDGPWKHVLRENEDWVHRLYNDTQATALLKGIVGEFKKYASQKRFTPILLYIPYKSDIDNIKRNGSSYYGDFLKSLEDILPVIDAADILLDVGQNIYLHDYYGGHLNETGNEMLAKGLYESLNRLTGGRWPEPDQAASAGEIKPAGPDTFDKNRN